MQLTFITRLPKRPENCARLCRATASMSVLTLALAPSPTANELVDATAKLDTEYQGAVRNFKSTIPEDLKQELKSASKRYKALQTLL